MESFLTQIEIGAAFGDQRLRVPILSAREDTQTRLERKLAGTTAGHRRQIKADVVPRQAGGVEDFLHPLSDRIPEKQQRKGTLGLDWPVGLIETVQNQRPAVLQGELQHVVLAIGVAHGCPPFRGRDLQCLQPPALVEGKPTRKVGLRAEPAGLLLELRDGAIGLCRQLDGHGLAQVSLCLQGQTQVPADGCFDAHGLTQDFPGELRQVRAHREFSVKRRAAVALNPQRCLGPKQIDRPRLRTFAVGDPHEGRRRGKGKGPHVPLDQVKPNVNRRRQVQAGNRALDQPQPASPQIRGVHPQMHVHFMQALRGNFQLKVEALTERQFAEAPAQSAEVQIVNACR